MCDPVTLPVSSLTHTPPAALNPSRSDSSRLAAEGRGPETAAGDASHRVVQAPDELAELVVAHSPGARPVVLCNSPR